MVMLHKLILKTNEECNRFYEDSYSMNSFDIIEFGLDDIVRSGLCKEYLVAKMEAGF